MNATFTMVELPIDFVDRSYQIIEPDSPEWDAIPPAIAWFKIDFVAIGHSRNVAVSLRKYGELTVNGRRDIKGITAACYSQIGWDFDLFTIPG
jgi:hypothetical protein